VDFYISVLSRVDSSLARNVKITAPGAQDFLIAAVDWVWITSSASNPFERGNKNMRLTEVRWYFLFAIADCTWINFMDNSIHYIVNSKRQNNFGMILFW
jgi:hypothetical protein